MLIVSVFDDPTPCRLWLLFDQKGGPQITSSVVMAGIDRNEGGLTDLALQAIDHRGPQLPLDVGRAKALVATLADAECTLEDDRAAAVLGWVALHQPSIALKFSADHLREAPVRQPNPLDQMALSLVGAGSAAGFHEVLLEWAGRCYEANQPEPANEILGYLDQPTDQDVAELAAFFMRHSESGWSPTPGALRIVGQLEEGQIRIVGRSVPESLPAQWFNQHLLPQLFRLHTASLVAMLTEGWWHESSLSWIAQKAPWGSQNHQLLLPDVLRAFRGSSQARFEEAIRVKLREQVVAAPADHCVRTAFPHLGARTLLDEALNARIPPTDDNLVQALNHLAPEVRRRVYVDAKWKQQRRAVLAGEIIAAVDVTDAASKLVRTAAFDLPDDSLDAWLRAIAGDLDPDSAQSLIDCRRKNVRALTAMATGNAAADLLLERWTSTHDLIAFEALSESIHSLDRLDSVPGAVRAYPGNLATNDRCHLLELYGAQQDRRPVLMELLEDRKAPRPNQRPGNDLLIVALGLLGEDLEDDDPGDILKVLVDICLTYRDIPVRATTYAVLGRCKPTAPVVDILLRRKTDDRSAAEAVAAALKAAGQALDTWSANSVGVEHAEVLKRLTLVNPTLALPYARAILDTDADNPKHRALAADILGHHGNDTDIARLELAHHQEPDPDTERAMAMAIRRRKVGDLAAAHQRLGELAGLPEESWQTLNEKAVWDNRGAALIAALDRIARHQAGHDFGSAIDQLSEVAKVVLFRAIDVAGDSLPLSQKNREKVRANTADYGEVLGWLQKSQNWPGISSLAALYDLRTEHVTPKGSHTPNPERGPDDYNRAEWLFQRGAGVLITKQLLPKI